MASGTQVRRVLLQLSADDGDTEAKIDAIAAKADELAAKHPELKVRIETAAASAKLKAIRDELKATADAAAANPVVPEVLNDDARRKLDELKLKLDELGAKAAGIKVKVDDKEADVKLLSLKARLAELGDKVARPDIRVSGVARAEADIAAVSLGLDRLDGKGKGGGFLSRLGGLLGPGSSLTEGVPLVGAGGPVAVGAGLAAVQALLPEVGALATGGLAGGLGLASFAAVAKSNYATASQAANQVQAAQIAYNAAVEHGTKQATAYKTEQIAISKAYAQLSPAQIALSEQIGNASNAWQSFVQSNTGGVSKILTQGIGMLPGVFSVMQQFIGPAETAIGGILDSLRKFGETPAAKQFMSFLEQLAGPSITAFGNGLIGLLPHLMRLFELFGKKDVLLAIRIAFDAIGAAIDGVTLAIEYTMREWDLISKGLHDMAHDFDVTRHAVASFAHDVAHYFDDVRHDAASFAHDVAHYFDDVRHAAATLGHDIAAHFDEIRHDIAHWADDVRHDVDNVVRFFEQLPGRILSALGDLSHLLWGAGMSIVNGLIGGIESAVPGLHSALSWVTSLIPSWKGPMDTDRRLLTANGQAIMGSLVSGLEAGMPGLHSQLERTTAVISGGVSPRLRQLATSAPGTAAGAGGYGAPVVTVRLDLGSAPRELRTFLKKSIRITGGNVEVIGA